MKKRKEVNRLQKIIEEQLVNDSSLRKFLERISCLNTRPLINESIKIDGYDFYLNEGPYLKSGWQITYCNPPFIYLLVFPEIIIRISVEPTDNRLSPDWDRRGMGFASSKHMEEIIKFYSKEFDNVFVLRDKPLTRYM